MRSYQPVSLWLLVGLNPVQAFVGPLIHEGTTCRTATRMEIRPATSSDRLPGIRPHRTSMAATPSGVGEGTEQEVAAEGQEGAPVAGTTAATAAKTRVKRSFGVLAATGATGALAGWCLAHPLGLDLELLGAVSGCVAAVGLLGQEGKVGDSTGKVGEFTLAAFEVASGVAVSTGVPAKVVGTVSEELLGVVEVTSGAVTKGYLDSLPEPHVRLEAKLAASKEKVGDLKGQLGKVTEALSEAKAQLLERKENKRIVDSAKTTAAQLVEAKATLAERDASITKSLQLARKEKDTFDKDLQAARAETRRFREMVESRADMDDNFKALARASETLEERVQEYEGRLRVLTAENDSIRGDYSAEIKSMEMERVSMRERISDLESSLSGTEARVNEQRDALEKELAEMAGALEEREGEANAATRLAAQMKEALSKSAEDTSTAIEKAAMEAADRASKEEKARSVQEMKAVKDAAAAVQREAMATAKEAQAAARAQVAQQKKVADEAIAREAAKAKVEATAMAARTEAADEMANKKKASVQKEAQATAAAKEKNKQQRQQEELTARQAKEGQRARAKAAENATKTAPATKKRKEAVAPVGEGAAAVDSREELMKMTVRDLRVRCKGQGKPTTGKKVDLVDRLLEALVSA